MNKWGFDKKIAALKAAKSDLPKDLSNAGQLYFQKNFDKQQWDGKQWQDVQRREPGTKAYKYAKGNQRNKPILVRTGKLRQALQKTKVSADYKKIVWGVMGVPYAQYLNEGTGKMTKRQFIGGSKEFKDKMKSKINYFFNKVMTSK